MTQYIIRRILLAIPVVIGILIVTFAMARLIPGDPCRAILGEKATQAACDRFIKDFGLDQPIPVQFWIYIKDLARGDFGKFDSLRPADHHDLDRTPPGYH
jgi:peptide/nickel transport system permease protein